MMANPSSQNPHGEIVEYLSLSDLCRTCGSDADWIIELVDEGILEPDGPDRRLWRFESTSITTIRKVQRLQQDLGVNLPGIALVLELVDEKVRLQRRLRALEHVT